MSDERDEGELEGEEWGMDSSAEEEERERREYAAIGSGVSEEFHYYSEGRRLIISDLQYLRDTFVEALLWAFTRCFLGVDRLLSLTRLHNLIVRDKEWSWKPEQWTLLWMTCGTLRELMKAVEALRQAGIRSDLTGDAIRSWNELWGLVRRWRSDEVYNRVRNTVAFHFDEQRELFDRGLEVISRERVRLHISERHGDSVQGFPFAQLIMLGGLFPDPKTRQRDLDEFVNGVRRSQARMGGLLFRILIAALKAKAPGLSPLQSARARLLWVLGRHQQDRLWAELLEEEKTPPRR